MKTELKCKLFASEIGLCNYVKEYEISKENIQSIVEFEESLALFYWELSE